MNKKVIVSCLVVSLVSASIGGTQAKGKVAVAKKEYSLSKKAGTYQGSIKVNLKAKKGYQVFYTTNGKWKVKKVIKSGKTKTFVMKKTTTLSVYATKKGKKMTDASLKKKKAKKYKYVIKQENSTPQASNEPTAEVTSQPSTKPAATTMPSTSQPSAEPMSTATIVTPQPSMKPMATTTPAATSTPQPSMKPMATTTPAATSTPLPVETHAPIAVDESTPKISITQEGAETANTDTEAVSVKQENGQTAIQIQQGGTYILGGGTAENPLTNVNISVAKNIEEEVNLVLNQLHIDNKDSHQDSPVIEIGKGTKNTTITIQDECSLVGEKSYDKEPASAVIRAKDDEAKLILMAADDNSSLLVDAVPEGAVDYQGMDPTDGISAKGELVIQSGKYTINTDGDCLKGTGADTEEVKGGVSILGGNLTLTSKQGNGIKSKSGNIKIYAGNISIEGTASDGIQAKNHSVEIQGGQIVIDHCYGDGIQGEEVKISGDATNLKISTYFEDAGTNYYNSALGTGNYNQLTSSGSTKTETVNVDTGSHKAIKAGTKACTYQYKNVSEESEYTAGTVYTQEASGGIVIQGGKIELDTTNTGIKYNAGGGFGGGFGGRPGENMGGSTGGNFTTVGEGQCIIGSPDDAIHSNNTCEISGGEVVIRSADDGITAPKSILITGTAVVDIQKAYEGIESGEIIIGSETDESAQPVVQTYTNDDGINASSKASVSYVYEDESEEVYTKKETSSEDNTMKIYSGYVNVMIADEETHSFALSCKDGSTTTGTYSANGDGIDCNGSFYAYGGTCVIYGSSSGDNSAVDIGDRGAEFYTGKIATILAVGSSQMAVLPTSSENSYVCTSSASGGFGGGPGFGGFGGRPGEGGSSSTISKEDAVAILEENGNSVVAFQAQKSANWVFYTAPDLTGASYQLAVGGSLQGELVLPNVIHDYRYESYDANGATTSGMTKNTK